MKISYTENAYPATAIAGGRTGMMYTQAMKCTKPQKTSFLIVAPICRMYVKHRASQSNGYVTSFVDSKYDVEDVTEHILVSPELSIEHFPTTSAN